MRSPETRSASKAVVLIALAALAAATVLAFAPVFNQGFVDYDDETNYVNNTALAGGAASLGWAWTANVLGVWQPVYWMFALGLARGAPPSPQVFHAASVGLHAAAAVLLCIVVVQLLRRADPDYATRSPSAVWICAALAVAVFAVHPLRAETVAWASGQAYELALLFFFASVACYLRARRPDGRLRIGWFIASIAIGAAAMLSKSAAVTLPLVLLIIDAYPLRRYRATEDRKPSAAVARAVVEKIPYFLMAAVTAFAAMGASRGVEQVADAATPTANAAQAVYSLAFPLVRTIVPIRLSPYYAKPNELGFGSAAVLLSAAAVVAVTVLAVAMRKRAPGLAAAWVAYVVVLLPVVGVVQHGHQLTADRYSNLATACLVPLLAFLLLRVGQSFRPLRWGAVPVVIILAFLAQRQSRLWADSETMWSSVIERYPRSAIAQRSYARVCTNDGRVDDAEQHLRRAIELDPSLAIAQYDLGVLCLESNRLDEAIAAFQTSIELLPTFSSAYHNLGIALASAGRPDEAVEAYKQGLARYDDHVPMLNNLGVLLLSLNRPAEAVEPLTRAAALSPDNVELSFNLGNAYRAAGDIRGAMQVYRGAINRDPSYGGAAIALSNIYVEKENWPAARRILEESYEVSPGSAAVATNLCWLLLRSNDPQVRDASHALAIAEKLWQQPATRSATVRDLYVDALVAAGRTSDAAAVRASPVQTPTD